MSDYTISVQGRGEEIEYAEGDERFIFEVSFVKVPYRLYARQFWTYPLPNGPHRLPTPGAAPSVVRHFSARAAA